MMIRSIEMVLDPDQDANEMEVEKSAARSQAGIEKARLRITPDDGQSESEKPVSPAKSQAEMVRQAMARKPQALIVEPANPADAELAQAISDARNAKVPVIMLGRPITGSSKSSDTSGAPMILVVPTPFSESAKKIVELAIRNAKNAGFDPQAGAFLVISPGCDVFLADRIAAVREALKAAKIDYVQEIRIGRDIEGGGKIVADRLQADTKPRLVFVFDFLTASASNKAVGLIGENRPFVQAGYTSDEVLPRQALAGEFAALAEFVPTRLIKKAVSTAVAAAQGREIGPRVEVLVSVRESPRTAGAPNPQAHTGPRPTAKGKPKSGSGSP